MPIITVRIDDELKEKMDELSYINWSEVIRRSIISVIEEENKKRKRNFRKKDSDRIKRASIKAEEFSAYLSGEKSEEKIREWRDKNWQL
ncbi:VapB-type antitoxin [Sulfolobus acidocaldarius SUSAZ]|nr:VapB-type antitoxin [Sulfolobus acidocaldarius SUSAZ]